ncbi:MAG: CpsD/CapB family tyrosine-protein kinase [Clostridia bacterium]|nr:CpsD/CapB family tyrosine-protein kinase [Clostridia bacterium]
MDPIHLILPGENDYFTAEAYKVLRTNLQFCGQDVRVIAFTNCLADEGKTTVALHTSRSFAQLGEKVLFLDTDMRKSVIADRNTDIQNARGLSEVLRGLCSFEESVYPVEDLPLDVLPAGQFPPNPVELLSGRHFSDLMAMCRSRYDYIIVDTPPLGEVIDAAVVARHCDGMALVIGSKKVRCRHAQDVIEQIRKSGCRILGAVRNG